jgi:hypothetical protein
MGGLHITSLIRGALEAWIKTEKTLRITKACIVEKEVHSELLATREVLEVTKREADFQEIILLSNLFLFLQNQITSIKLHIFRIVSIEEESIAVLRLETSHVQRLFCKSTIHEKMLTCLHYLVTQVTLKNNITTCSTQILICKNFFVKKSPIRRDLDGWMEEFQINLAQ